MRFLTVRQIKYWLDTILIPAWKDVPVGYECNSKTWDNVMDYMPKAPKSTLMKRVYITHTFIDVCDDLPDGFHPIFADNNKTPKGRKNCKRKT